MRVFCYFVEPASYTLDLAHNIHEKHGIEYCFIKSDAFAISDKKSSKLFLDQVSFIYKIYFLISKFLNNDFIIINGYNNYVFIINFILNIFSINKRYIAIESDTPLRIPEIIFKKFIKRTYLSIIFCNKWILGFAGGNYSHKNLFRYYGMKEERIFLMPMMVNNHRFIQNEKIFPKKFTFLYVGRLIKIKNVEGLIKQFNKYFQRDDVELRIVGDGKEKIYLERTYSSKNILFTGNKFSDELVNEFKSASCFVLPSLSESWGLVINEALSSSLPVIVTKQVGAAFDLIRNKNTGFIVEDINDFGPRMKQIYDDSDLLYDLSSSAKHFMLNHWNYDLYSQCMIDVIRFIEND